VAPTGDGEPRVETFPCVAGTRCVDSVAGAICQAVDQCVDGQVECHGTRAAECVGGRWVEEPCARGCVQNALDASCRPNLATVRYSNNLQYQMLFARPNLSDWDPTPQPEPARGFVVASFANGRVLDVVTTAMANPATFNIEIVDPAVADDDDFLLAAPVRLTADGDLIYGVFDPGLSVGSHAIDVPSEDARLWFWSWTATRIPSEAGVVIQLDGGGGAAFAFDYLRYVYDFAEGFYGRKAGTSLAFWLGMGVSWNCGACFAQVPWSGFSSNADVLNHVWLPGGADQGYWSGAVLAHELGHWVMKNYGASPNEGGTHVMGIPSHPGLAWSEGFATWFSSLVRNEGLYYDKQGGSFLWVDLDDRRFSSGVPWNRPWPGGGLEQMIDENEVASMLWRLSTDENVDGLLAALSSPRMTTSPFLRGYTTRTWEGLNAEGYALPYTSTTASAPHLADFLDAVVCGGVVSANAVDAVTEPASHYPYPSWAPLCRAGQIPFETRWDPGATPSVTAAWLVPLEGELRLTLVDLRTDPPTEGPSLVIPGGTPSGEARLAWHDADPGVEAGLRAETRGIGWGLAGIRPRTPKAVPAPSRTGPEVVLKGRRWGRALPVVRADREPATPGPGPAPIGSGLRATLKRR
jgi:hypothetical protein